CMQPLEFPWTF
nr:immunoglobulin light chain junction region [Macaca mulatta]MOV77545.1 immunoglobulin light chain junction region [Macaca mulatta]MOV77560.1 immunoglobulin light chain junction region [Macaca mulatta]MOV77693.1 immunoglobulin light chain junction region [Macaca mulatta]MOV77728.1 immunoglobulin light chain junction region [Macaca mulatta]